MTKHNSIFGKNLKEVREFLGISQDKLSSKTGLTKAAISMIENGKREPSLGTVCKVLEALNVDFERMVRP